MIITNNEEALRGECFDVLPEEIGALRDQLELELKHSEEIGQLGIGLAAPQIGIKKKFAIVRCDCFNVDLINCKIEKGYDKAIFEQEGCLSFPGRFEKTNRFQEVYITNNLVEPYSFIAYGLLSVACQHELDHLVGILLPDISIKEIKFKGKLKPNDKCFCNSNKKYKKCCGILK